MTVREHVLNIVHEFWTTQKRLKSLTEAYFRQHKVSDSDRRRITVLSREIIRWTYRLDIWIEHVSSRQIDKITPQLLVILEMATYEITMDTHIPNHAAINSAVELAGKRIGSFAKGFVNGILRGISRLDEKAVLNGVNPENKLSYWHSYQGWMVDRWTNKFGENEIEDVLSAGNTYPTLTVRINSNKITPGGFREICQDLDILVKPSANSTIFFDIEKNAGRLLRHECFRTGACSFQDRAAGMLVELLDPHEDEIILDVCAAPGTKSLYSAELMKGSGTVYSSDVDEERVALGIQDLDRHGFKSIHWNTRDATKDEFPTADRILIDAPCTGTGVIRRRPDIKWRRDETEISEMTEIQFAILSNVSAYVKSDGILVYGTCSMEDEENMGVVNRFLESHPEFFIDTAIPEALKTWENEEAAVETFPHRHALDGMFGIRLKKHV